MEWFCVWVKYGHVWARCKCNYSFIHLGMPRVKCNVIILLYSPWYAKDLNVNVIAKVQVARRKRWRPKMEYHGDGVHQKPKYHVDGVHQKPKYHEGGVHKKPI